MSVTVPPTRTRLRRLALGSALAASLTAGLAAAPAQAESMAAPRIAAARAAVVAAPAARTSVATTVTSASVGRKALAMYGKPRSGMLWHSGIWTGNGMSAARSLAAESWAGRRFDFTTVYPSYDSWAEMADSSWITREMAGWNGRLVVGLPLLPNNRKGQWADVTSGSHDYVFRQIARDLRAGGRGDAAIRVGLEANGDWFAWGATYATASKFRAAFQRVVTIMNRESPGLTFWFDTSSGFGLPGQKTRLDALTVLYPGDRYVDGISMDHYDFWELKASNSLSFSRALRPVKGPGLGDAVAFARAHHKGFAVPEWGVHGASFGGGDNPYFIVKMHQFFYANRDVLVFECYFNEPMSYIKNSLFSPVQMPKSAAVYKRWF
ncbi:MAG: glycosyl hydrolase [Kineosporiaceae bacterium]